MPASRAAATSRCISGATSCAPASARLPAAWTKSIWVSTSQRIRPAISSIVADRAVDAHDRPLAGIPDMPETGAPEQIGVAHVVESIRDVRIRLDRGRAVREGVLDGRVEQ